MVGDAYGPMFRLTSNNTEGICAFNIDIEYYITFGRFLLMVNFPLNFVFYMTNIAKFREVFLRVRQYCLYSGYWRQVITLRYLLHVITRYGESESILNLFYSSKRVVFYVSQFL